MTTTPIITADDVIAALGGDLTPWAKQCHAASLEVVKAIGAPARVARGTCRGVGGQHSWVALGDPYADDVRVIDPTLWSYVSPDEPPFVHLGLASVGWHVPHGGHSTIWEWGKPPPAERGQAINLTPSVPLSGQARRFVAMLGPLDRRGWSMLAGQAPVAGWPAAEIIAAMDDTPELTALVPVDRLGMLTDRNPGGLYLP